PRAVRQVPGLYLAVLGAPQIVCLGGPLT
ncbi:MAG: hypothetical protein JWO79_1381, partial [Actinomycetia bacterium]|nr:hypothetical protein [Actinomycetes bacterium]